MADAVINPVAVVFEKWANGIKKVVGDNYSMDINSTISKTPYARMFLMGNPGVRWDLAGNETATNPSFQVESYYSGRKPLESVYAIDSASHAIMTGMGFRRSYGPELMTNADSNIKRVVSRYTRIYTGEEF